MKLKIFLLSTLSLLVAINSTGFSSKQLFDVFSKELDHKNIINASASTTENKSIFGNLVKKPSMHSEQKNIFDSLNFNQIKEKSLDKSETHSLFAKVLNERKEVNE